MEFVPPRVELVTEDHMIKVMSVVRLLSAGMGLLLARTLGAAPAHVIRFDASGPRANVCDTLTWRDNLTFYNATDSTVTVRVLGISNGTPSSTSPDRIDIPPGHVVWADLVLRSAWLPIDNRAPGIWMMHLDVPEGVIIESRDEMFQGSACISSPFPPSSLGKVSLPVFRAAVPANQPQVHLGTDIGSKDARINVGIYNQSDVIANAHIEVRRSCDNSLVDSRDVQIPPDSLVQFAGFRKGLNICGSNASTFNWLRYTVITVDEPSMTFATALSGELNVIPGLAPEVGIGIPGNARY
jgi:hypothetical protein